MKIYSVLTVVTMPVLIGIFGFTTPNYAHAATPPHQHLEVKPQQLHKKPHIKDHKHRQKRQLHRLNRSHMNG
jgi:hypothetical protein